MTSCILRDNAAYYGGGIGIDNGLTVEVKDCIVESNSSSHRGAGIYINRGSPTISGCIIRNNIGSGSNLGGGIYSSYSSFKITNCIVVKNFANTVGRSDGGGGIFALSDSSPSTITNCTISDNTPYGIVGYNSFLIITNSILWGNLTHYGYSGEVYAHPGYGIEPSENWRPIISYSDIQGGYSGESNINIEPLFKDSEYSDYHLDMNSPCIDSGTSDNAPGTDIEGNLRPQGDGFDMGAFEFLELD